jgi:hypothetical protein
MRRRLQGKGSASASASSSGGTPVFGRRRSEMRVVRPVMGRRRLEMGGVRLGIGIPPRYGHQNTGMLNSENSLN